VGREEWSRSVKIFTLLHLLRSKCCKAVQDAKTFKSSILLQVWCIPFDKRNRAFKWSCKKSLFASNSVQFLIAQDKLIHDCGLNDVTIKVWVAPVNAIEPVSGLHIWWYGLWMERAEGVSLNQLADSTRPKTAARAAFLSVLQVECVP
jgi:hypothetical protein